MGFQTKFLESGQPSDYESNIDALAADGYNVIITVGSTVNGALLAAKENNLPAIGADVDPYNTDPEAQSALISSAMLNVDVGVYNDWDNKIPADLKAQIQIKD